MSRTTSLLLALLFLIGCAGLSSRTLLAEGEWGGIINWEYDENGDGVIDPLTERGMDNFTSAADRAAFLSFAAVTPPTDFILTWPDGTVLSHPTTTLPLLDPSIHHLALDYTYDTLPDAPGCHQDYPGCVSWAGLDMSLYRSEGNDFRRIPGSMPPDRPGTYILLVSRIPNYQPVLNSPNDNPFFIKTAYAADQTSYLDGFVVAGYTLIIGDPIEPKPDVCTENCNSNVLFLPGLEASRLYIPVPCTEDGCEGKLWEPAGDALVNRLSLDGTGASIRSDIYTKDVIDKILFGSTVYQNFTRQMDRMQDDGLFAEWEAIPYDWRLSLSDILESGNKIGNQISYTEATTSPYILQELKRLASTSRTGKVTIIAHSNGGLLAKALMVHIGDAETARLIDKVILVASPQSGTPEAVGALLNGYHQNHFPVLHIATARTFAENMPSAYTLLPSERYFTDVQDPVISFEQSVSGTRLFRSMYGNEIDSPGVLQAFLRGLEGREKPEADNDTYPNILNPFLLDYAFQLHDTIDAWTPPASVRVYQIAGWGIDTLKRIEYVEGGFFHCIGVDPCLDYDPIPTEDGDGTVVVPSALMMSTSSPNVGRWWVDLASYDTLTRTERDHAGILEVKEVNSFIQQIIESSSLDTLPRYLSTSTPRSSHSDMRLRYYLHSPLSLSIYDDQGNHVGVSTTTGEIETNIPGAYYHEFGHVKYISVPASTTPHLVLSGYASGGFTLKIEEAEGDLVTASTTFADIPSGTSTLVTMDFPTGTISGASPLSVDKDGNGITDFFLRPKVGETVTMDITAPEAIIAFSTSTKVLSITGVDDRGITSLTSTTTYPTRKKNQKEYKGSATTTVTIADESGNTTLLVYTEELPSPDNRDVISLVSVSYNGMAQYLGNTLIKYKWNTNSQNEYTTLASFIRTMSTSTESHFRPKQSSTILMTKPIELDDSDIDTDAVDVRPTKLKLPGMIVPRVETRNGGVLIVY